MPLIRRGAWGERQILWKYSAPIFFSSAVLITGEWLCEAIMFRQPDGKAQMGLYLAAIQWTAAIEFLQNTLASPAVSLMSNLYWTNDLVRFRKLCLANIGLIAGASGAIAGVLAIAAPWIMRAYGSGFGPAAHVLQLVCVMAAVRAVSRATSTVLFSVGKVRVEWAFSMVRIALQISLWYALVSRGAAGLAIAMLGAYLAQLILQGGYVYALLRHSRTGAEAVDSAGGLS